jgi:hypothetical protein
LYHDVACRKGYTFVTVNKRMRLCYAGDQQGSLPGEVRILVVSRHLGPHQGTLNGCFTLVPHLWYLIVQGHYF